MNRTQPTLSARQTAAALPESDVSHEIDTVLRAMIVLLAILMATVLIGAAIKSLTHWIAFN